MKNQYILCALVGLQANSIFAAPFQERQVAAAEQQEIEAPAGPRLLAVVSDESDAKLAPLAVAKRQVIDRPPNDSDKDTEASFQAFAQYLDSAAGPTAVAKRQTNDDDVPAPLPLSGPVDDATARRIAAAADLMTDEQKSNVWGIGWLQADADAVAKRQVIDRPPIVSDKDTEASFQAFAQYLDSAAGPTAVAKRQTNDDDVPAPLPLSGPIDDATAQRIAAAADLMTDEQKSNSWGIGWL
jgi:hypothetical protein